MGWLQACSCKRQLVLQAYRAESFLRVAASKPGVFLGIRYLCLHTSQRCARRRCPCSLCVFCQSAQAEGLRGDTLGHRQPPGLQASRTRRTAHQPNVSGLTRQAP